jgi:hypothetical protein
MAIIEFHEYGTFVEEEYVDTMIDAGFERIDEEGGTYVFRNRDLTAVE